LPKIIEFDVEESESGKRIRISPLAKKMAEKLNVDFQSIKGSGPRGRIIARDVEEAAKMVQKPEAEPKPAAKPAPVQKAQVLQSGADFEIKSIPNIRKLIANAMHQSLQNSAQLTHHLSADARQLLKLRKKYKTEYSEGKLQQNVTINDLVCYAVIRALEKFPQANTHYLGDKMKWFNKVHLGLAVDTDRGLMVPALQNADDLSVTGLSFQLQQLAAQARNGNINPDILSPEAATFTVSNLGNYGVEMFTPVINLPQVAILGVCTIVPRPKEIEEGVYGFVPMIGLSLTYNHQAIDGGEATRFLAEIKAQIECLQV
jgi:pyruvate dehydrogenase E2 component (dihydrolipoamide acetyltransferase)